MLMNKGMFVAALLLLMGGEAAVAQTSYEEMAEHAMRLTQTDSLAAAVDAYKQLLKVYPSDHRNPLVLTNIGQILEKSGQDQEALRHYDMALNTLPDNVPILCARANLLLRIGNWEKAYRDYCHILDLDAQHRQALTYRAYISMRQHRLDEAKQDYTKVLALYPDDETARTGYALMLQEMGKLADAIAQLTLLVDQHPDNARYLAMRAEVEAANNQPELALFDLDKAIELDAGNKDYYLNRGFLYYDQEKYRLAHADFELAIKLGASREALKEVLKKK